MNLFTDLVNYILGELDPTADQQQHILTTMQRRSSGPLPRQVVTDTIENLTRLRMSKEAVDYLLNIWDSTSDRNVLHQNLQNSLDEFRASFGDKKVDEEDVKRLFLKHTADPIIKLIKEFGTYFANSTDPDYGVLISQLRVRAALIPGDIICAITLLLIIIICGCCYFLQDLKPVSPTTLEGAAYFLGGIFGFVLKLYFASEHFAKRDDSGVQMVISTADMALELDTFEKNFEEVFSQFFHLRPDILSYRRTIHNPELYRVIANSVESWLGRDIVFLLLQYILSPYELQKLNTWRQLLHKNHEEIKHQVEEEAANHIQSPAITNEEKEKTDMNALETQTSDQIQNAPILRFRGVKDDLGKVTLTAFPNTENKPESEAITYENPDSRDIVEEKTPTKNKTE